LKNLHEAIKAKGGWHCTLLPATWSLKAGWTVARLAKFVWFDAAYALLWCYMVPLFFFSA
jgi:hypothetical protein